MSKFKVGDRVRVARKEYKGKAATVSCIRNAPQLLPYEVLFDNEEQPFYFYEEDLRSGMKRKAIRKALRELAAEIGSMRFSKSIPAYTDAEQCADLKSFAEQLDKLADEI